MCSSDLATQLGAILASSSGGVTVNATGMDGSYLNALSSNFGKIAANGITGTVAINSGVNGLGDLFGKIAGSATVNVDASDMTSALSTVASNIGKVTAITHLSIDNGMGLEPGAITALLGKDLAADAIVTVDGMDAAALNAVADGIAGVKAGDEIGRAHV